MEEMNIIQIVMFACVFLLELIAKKEKGRSVIKFQLIFGNDKIIKMGIITMDCNKWCDIQKKIAF